MFMFRPMCGLPSRLTLLHVACALGLLIASPSRAEFPWPANGAPVCNAPGDQSGLVHVPQGCGYGLSLTWIDHAPGADSVVAGSIGIQPPVGDCAPFGQRLVAPGVRDMSAALAFGGLLGIPGCQAPIRCTVWIEAAGAGEQVVASMPLWFGAERVVVDDGTAVRSHPRMSSSGLQSVIDTAMVVVWSDDRTGVPQIRAQRIAWRGQRTWGSAGIVIAPTGSAQTEPEVTTLSDGSSLVVWTDARAGSDIYAIRLLPTGEVAAGWPATGLAFEARPELASSPRFAGHYYENLFVAWRESGPRFGGGAQVVARKLHEVTVPNDPDIGLPDPAWAAAGVPLAGTAAVTVAAVDEFCDMRPDHQGGLIAVWSDTRTASPANPTDLYAQRLTASGAVAAGWPATGRAVCTATGRQGAARLDVHPDGTSVYAWEDERGGPDPDIYAALLEPNGVIPCCQWVVNGLPASAAPGAQTGPVVEAANSGGMLVAWTDARNAGTTGLDIYAQAFSFDGRNVDVPPGTPVRLLLLRPYPNPSRGSTRLALDLPATSRVKLEVLDVAGRRVRTVASGVMAPGRQIWSWDGLDDGGRKVRAGMFRVRALVDGVSNSRPLVIIE